ncbi:MAG TPA: glycerophosphodiester phosphodiesterase family protein [Propionicimonas sp.]|nr:glycerophosphodiester phosphodiesterase family protein [Propionicimonas sp.]
MTLLSPAAAATVIPVPVGKILLQAHRGGKELGAPENSARVFRLAVDSHIVDRIETDVRITKDNKLVIVHDQALPTRCSPYTGALIHQLTWSQLQTVTCEGEPIPALSEVFDIVRGTPVALNLELKIYDDMATAAKTDLAKRVVAAVLASGLPKGQVMLSSFFWRSYAGVAHKYAPGIVFSALEQTYNGQPTDAIFSNIRRAKSLGVDAFAGPIKYSNEGLLAFIRDYGGMHVGLMDTEGTSDLRFALAHGLRNVTNDDPVEAREALDLLLADVKANPLTLKVTTTAVPVKTVLSRSMSKYARTYPQVIGSTGPLPVGAAKHLKAVRFTVTVTGKGHGTVELAPKGSRVGIDGVRTKIPNGKKTFVVLTVPGDGGDIRVRVTGKAKVVIKVSGYSRADY